MNNPNYEIGELAAALSKAQSAMHTATRDKTANIKTKAGYTYSYGYATLASLWGAVRKALAANELSVIQVPSYDHENKLVIVSTTLMHSSGQFIAGDPLPIPVGEFADAKDIGGAITYARRFALASILGVASSEEEDDDADSLTSARRSGEASDALYAQKQEERKEQIREADATRAAKLRYATKGSRESVWRKVLAWTSTTDYKPTDEAIQEAINTIKDRLKIKTKLTEPDAKRMIQWIDDQRSKKLAFPSAVVAEAKKNSQETVTSSP